MSDCKNFRNSQVVPSDNVSEEFVPTKPTYEELYHAMIRARKEQEGRFYYESIDRGNGDDSDSEFYNHY